MTHPQRLIVPITLGTAYFIAAGLAVALTRFDGGVAFLWLATPILSAALMVRPKEQWWPSIVACGIASFLATGWFGLGWAWAGPLALNNVGEAMIAAWVFRAHADPRRPLGSLGWLMHFAAAVGVIAPFCAALSATAMLAAANYPTGPTFMHYFAGHALGSVTFTPIALMMTRKNRRAAVRDLRRRDGVEVLALVGLSAAVDGMVFLQQQFPLLFLPMLPMILIAFRVGRLGVAASIAIVAVIGGAATIVGTGPIHLIDAPLGEQLQFFQLFLAATVLTLLPVTADLENRSRRHRQMRESEAGYRMIAEYSSDVILSLKIDGTIRYVSPSCREMGYEPRELVGRNCSILIAPENLEQAAAAHYRSVDMGGQTNRFEYLALLASGERRWCESHARLIVDEQGRPEGILSIVRDISVQKGLETSLTKAARVDSLTGLDNRLAYREAIERRTIDPRQDGDCIAVLDIDRFKRVNDRFGHDAGDEVLKGFADVARGVVREQDIIARVGGEEFAIYFPNTSVDQALAVCERLRLQLGTRMFRVGTTAINVTVSGGVAQLGPEGIDHALKIADLALYQAKSGGRNQFALAA